MKKKIIATITMLCLLTVLYNYLRLPDYHITNSIPLAVQIPEILNWL